jgi:hypothetical protein
MSGCRASVARRVAGAGVAAVLATALLSCSPRTVHQQATIDDSGSAKLVATRWWSNSAVRTGSTIDQARPDSAVARLHPSRREYCGMLEQTRAAGKTILPGAIGSDPALIESMTAFFSELQQVAPSEINAAWRVLGPTVRALVKSGGVAPTTSDGDAAAIREAANAVAADAKKNCNVDLGAAK